MSAADRTWSGRLALLGTETSDGRIIAPDAKITVRAPAFLAWQKTSRAGHEGSIVIGGFTRYTVTSDAIVVAPGDGFLLDTPEAAEALPYIERGVMRPSIDPGAVTISYIDGNTEAEVDWDAWFFGYEDVRLVEYWTELEVGGATVVALSAFADTSIALDPADQVASGSVDVRALAASAAGHALPSGDAMPMAYVTAGGYAVDDDRWLSRPELGWAMGVHRVMDGPDRGRVQGYICPAKGTHLGMYQAGRKVTPPRTTCDHFYFRQTALSTPSGLVAVGKLVVEGGHVDDEGTMSWSQAARAYDDTSTAWAVVACGDDDFGTWVSGYVLDDVPDAVVAQGLSAAYSGHWYAVPGQSTPELVAAIGVNAPSFPVPRTDAQRRTAPVAASMSIGRHLVTSHMRTAPIPATGHPMAARYAASRYAAARSAPSSLAAPAGIDIPALAREIRAQQRREDSLARIAASASGVRDDRAARTAAQLARVTAMRAAITRGEH